MDLNPGYRLKRRLSGDSTNYNWQTRTEWWRDSDTNRKHMIRVWKQLHYLACHAPEPVRRRWAGAYSRLMGRLDPKFASVQYLEKYASVRWL